MNDKKRQDCAIKYEKYSGGEVKSIVVCNVNNSSQETF
jgi:hypothetical protein